MSIEAPPAALLKFFARSLSLMLLLVLATTARLNLFAQIAEAGDGKSGAVTTPHLTVELVPLTPEIAQGHTAPAGLLFHLQDRWHIYWTNAGAPPRVKWTLPTGITARPLQFPAPY